MLRRSHADHRDLRGGLRAAPSTEPKPGRDQDRYVMIPITTVSLFTTNRLCCWLIAGNVEALPNQASTTRNAPSAAYKSHSIRLLSAIVRPFGLTPRTAYHFHARPLRYRRQPNRHSAA
jgi:hypothetical protein